MARHARYSGVGCLPLRLGASPCLNIFLDRFLQSRDMLTAPRNVQADQRKPPAEEVAALAVVAAVAFALDLNDHVGYVRIGFAFDVESTHTGERVFLGKSDVHRFVPFPGRQNKMSWHQSHKVLCLLSQVLTMRQPRTKISCSFFRGCLSLRSMMKGAWTLIRAPRLSGARQSSMIRSRRRRKRTASSRSVRSRSRLDRG